VDKKKARFQNDDGGLFLLLDSGHGCIEQHEEAIDTS
jgi:hypothetical protein